MITTTRNEASSLKADYNLTYIWLISIVAALGGLLFGWDWVVIGGAKPFFERYFELKDPALVGWANSCALIGCLVGALVAGALSDKFGRKRLLIASAFLFAATSLGNALAPTFGLFIFWRMLGGVAIGLASNLSPMYIAEVAPAQMRGRLVAINQLTIVIGILLAQYLNWFLVRDLPQGATDEFIRSSWFGQKGWRWMFGLTAVPSVLFFVGMFWVPESPRWLAKNGWPDGARGILAKIGGEPYGNAALTEIQSTLASEEIRHVRFQDLLEPRMKAVLVLGVVLAVFQQWCGINVIFNYAEEIFRAAGYDISAVLKNIAWTGSVNLVFTFVALGVVDRGGRRPLMLVGEGGLACIYVAMGFCYGAGVKGLPMLLLVLAAIGCYAMSLAPVTWVVISEIFPNRIRGAAMSVAVTSLWIACFILTYTFPILNQRLSPVTFTGADITDLAALVARLKQHAEPSVNMLYERLPASTRSRITEFDPARTDVEGLRVSLAEKLNLLLAGDAFYDEARFGGVKLSAETQALLAQKPRGDDLARLHRLLIEDTCPELRRSRQVGAGRTFWLYAGICVVGFLFIAWRLPETKGKTLEQIEKELVD